MPDRQFQYKVVSLIAITTSEQETGILNDYAEQGWRLVQIRFDGEGARTFYFERPL